MIRYAVPETATARRLRFRGRVNIRKNCSVRQKRIPRRIVEVASQRRQRRAAGGAARQWEEILAPD